MLATSASNMRYWHMHTIQMTMTRYVMRKMEARTNRRKVVVEPKLRKLSSGFVASLNADDITREVSFADNV